MGPWGSDRGRWVFWCWAFVTSHIEYETAGPVLLVGDSHVCPVVVCVAHANAVVSGLTVFHFQLHSSHPLVGQILDERWVKGLLVNGRRIFVSVVEVLITTEHQSVLAFVAGKLKNAVSRRCKVNKRLLNNLR